jgi:hypothetical protein
MFYKTIIDKDKSIKEIHKIVVHRFSLYDSYCTDEAVSEHINIWKKTKPGHFIVTSSYEKPEVHKFINAENSTYDFAIVAFIDSKNLTEYYLKYQNI